MSALQALISRMGGLKEGRKALVLVSEGYSNILPPQMRDANSQLPGFGNPAAGNPLAGDNDPNEARAQWIASLDMDSDLREIYAAANRNNVALYPVDPRGLSTGEFGVDQNIGGRSSRDFLNSTIDTLRVLASETDGRAIVNRNDLTLAMKQIVRDSSAYYLVGYSSTQAGIGREVPRNQGSREAARHPGARAPGLLGAHVPGSRARACSRQTGSAQGGGDGHRRHHRTLTVPD
jgi:VWFA-related protein